MTEEAVLIERAKDGDQHAFRELYNLHVVALFRFLRQYSGDAFQVEEWVQKSFIKAYRGIGTFRGTSRFTTWLFTIALNVIRTDSRRKDLVTFNSEELQNWSGAEETDLSFEWRETMRAWLSELPESKRAVFLLYEVEGYSHEEIASMLRITESSSRTLLSRAKQFLREKIASEERTV